MLVERKIKLYSAGPVVAGYSQKTGRRPGPSAHLSETFTVAEGPAVKRVAAQTHTGTVSQPTARPNKGTI